MNFPSAQEIRASAASSNEKMMKGCLDRIQDKISESTKYNKRNAFVICEKLPSGMKAFLEQKGYSVTIRKSYDYRNRDDCYYSHYIDISW